MFSIRIGEFLVVISSSSCSRFESLSMLLLPCFFDKPFNEAW